MPPKPSWRVVSLFVAFLTLAIPAAAQTTARPSRITQPVDERNLVVLTGSTHPLARPQFDQGPAPADLPMNRMLLLLSHTKEQEAAVNTLLEQQQDQSSANYHKWLTPEQYGEQFGPTPEEISTVTGWLQSHGFSVAHAAKGRHVIEFSGTAAQVKEALHTEIHRYVVKGEEHWANASDPQIPAALSPVVAGVRSLPNFHSRPAITFGSCGANLTPVSPFATVAPSCFFGLGPYDVATIYNIKPLWNEGIDGTGQTIALSERSNINVQDVRNFRKLFGLAPNDPQVIVDGPDPGLLNPPFCCYEPEAVADTEVAGAVAKNATIKVVVSGGTDATDGMDLASQYIVENNLAPIMSQSSQICELYYGTAGNQFYYNLWQQAAAQGISVFVAAGDTGSASCDVAAAFAPGVAQFGFMQNAIASTPYNVAVGGTDFIDFFNPTRYWSLTNDPDTKASATGYIPEMPWNSSCANPVWAELGYSADPIVNCNNPNLALWLTTLAGAGGPSNCTISDSVNPLSCRGGYPKPSWQRGLGVPADGKRDLPDVSLFAAFFADVIGVSCQADVGFSCDPNAPFLGLSGFYGTSLSSPTLAGIMALVNQ